MIDLKHLPKRHEFDQWVRRIRHSFDLGNLNLDIEQVPAQLVLLPTHTTVNTSTLADVPAWVHWETPTVCLVHAGNPLVEAAWSVKADGKVQARGVATVEFSPSGPPAVHGVPAGSGQVTAYTLFSQRQLTRRTELIAADGLSAEFEAVRALRDYVAVRVRAKNARVAVELFDEHPIGGKSTHRPPVVLDAIGEERIVDELCFGNVGQTNPALVFRALRQAAHTNILDNVPIHIYVAKRIDSACETSIRRTIGDPHLGRRIRREFLRWREATQTPTVDKFIDHWNTNIANTSDRIGVKSVQQALTAGSDSSVDHVSFEGLYRSNGGEQ